MSRHGSGPQAYERRGDLNEQRGDTSNAIRYHGKLVELWKGLSSATRILYPRGGVRLFLTNAVHRQDDDRTDTVGIGRCHPAPGITQDAATCQLPLRS